MRIILIISAILLSIWGGDFCWAQQCQVNVSSLAPQLRNTDVVLREAFISQKESLNDGVYKQLQDLPIIGTKMFGSSKIGKEYWGGFFDKLENFLKAGRRFYIEREMLDNKFAKLKAAAVLEKKATPILKKIVRLLKRPFTSKADFDKGDPVKVLEAREKTAYKELHQEIMNEYGLNEQEFELIRMMCGEYFYGPDKIEISGVWKLCRQIKRLYPEYAYVNVETYIIYEAVLFAGMNFIEKGKDVKAAENYLISILYPQTPLKINEVYADIYNWINKMDRNSIEVGITLIKWLANVAELDEYPREQLLARNFLKFFVKNELEENKDILQDFEEMVLIHVKSAQTKYGRDSVKVVPMLTGAEPLGQRLRQTIKRAGIKVAVQDLLLTVKMCEELRDRYEKGESESISLELGEYLIANNIIDERTRHIIFIDTGFMGTINKYLSRALDLHHISKNYLVLANGNDIFNSYIPLGLNRYSPNKWTKSFDRLVKFAFIVDDGFEHMLLSPAGFIEQTKVKRYVTSRKWFYNLVVKSIGNMPAYIAALQGESSSESLYGIFQDIFNLNPQMNMNKGPEALITSSI